MDIHAQCKLISYHTSLAHYVTQHNSPNSIDDKVARRHAPDLTSGVLLLCLFCKKLKANKNFLNRSPSCSQLHSFKLKLCKVAIQWQCHSIQFDHNLLHATTRAQTDNVKVEKHAGFRKWNLITHCLLVCNTKEQKHHIFVITKLTPYACMPCYVWCNHDSITNSVHVV